MEDKTKCGVCGSTENLSKWAESLNSKRKGDPKVYHYRVTKARCRKCNRERATAFRNSPKGREYWKSARQKERSPEKARARAAIWYAVKKGKLVRPSHCSECGVACKPEAHHDDYSKVLEVRWLCTACHFVADKRVINSKG